MFWDTAKLIAVALVLSTTLSAFFYLMLKPMNVWTFSLTGTIAAPMEQMAQEKLQELNDGNSVVASQMLQYYQVEANTVRNIEQARAHDEAAWLVFGFVAFAAVILFYTAWTQKQR